MPNQSKAVADTSVLLNLAFIDRLELLKEQFEEIIVPKKVMEEIREGEKGKDKINEFRDELKMRDVEEDSLYIELRDDLDKGESAVINYATKNQVDLALLDETEGRSKAKKHGIKVTGVIGILLAQNKEETEFDIETEVRKLRKEGFWISEELFQRII